MASPDIIELNIHLNPLAVVLTCLFKIIGMCAEAHTTQFLMHNGQFLPSPLNNIYCK